MVTMILPVQSSEAEAALAAPVDVEEEEEAGDAVDLLVAQESYKMKMNKSQIQNSNLWIYQRKDDALRIIWRAAARAMALKEVPLGNLTPLAKKLRSAIAMMMNYPIRHF